MKTSLSKEAELSPISWWSDRGKRLFESLSPLEALSVVEAVVAWHDPRADLDVIASAGEYLIDHASTYTGPNTMTFTLYHSLGVARTVAELGLEADIVAAALLHEVLINKPGACEEIVNQFGENVLNIIMALSGGLRADCSRDEYADQAQIFQTLLNTLTQGYAGMAAVIIEVADAYDRLCISPRQCFQSQHSALALRVMEVFAPIAERLGIRKLKAELEDRAFRILDFDNYRRIRDYLKPRRKNTEVFLDSVIEQIREWLELVGISAFVYARRKTIYSIYEKTQRRQKDITEISDLVGIRIIVDQVRDCYQVLEIVHALWTSIPEEFDDYIRNRKTNGYQSLHTTVISDSGLKFEVQIRTWQMHAYAEFGMVVHWRYKGNPSLGGDSYDRMFVALQSQLTIGKTYKEMDIMIKLIGNQLENEMSILQHV